MSSSESQNIYSSTTLHKVKHFQQKTAFDKSRGCLALARWASQSGIQVGHHIK